VLRDHGAIVAPSWFLTEWHPISLRGSDQTIFRAKNRKINGGESQELVREANAALEFRPDRDVRLAG
jgi:hypothetical protein